ncbi:hypothetical protein HCH_00796 [Hahella chejuensis KCTC 2396]|uniref:Uncharacterized protein n=1 Tax=Hahella chejuensis (strain KCTC 2396) TaxID=349521 RepID=Q2SNT3_HAHCH|nr:hypothetical protein HCH_00796 [Hahella chejuensis KCTC 2396]
MFLALLAAVRLCVGSHSIKSERHYAHIDSRPPAQDREGELSALFI